VTTTATLGADAAAQTDATTAAATAATTGAGSGAKTTGAEGFGMDKDAFLKILVEQLRHQDPSNPGDSQQYIEQMTQFSILEQLTNISEHAQRETANAAAAQAINLVGHEVEYLDGSDTRSGTVTSVDFSSGTPLLTVGDDEDVTLGSITVVR
jgi:flagellar basal-body rod modification protein FlgD